MLYIGIDLWTSACKLLLVTEDGSILNTVTKEYPLIFPHPSWSEQKPEDWWDAVVTGVPELLHGFDANEVAGIGTGGQMHGLVALDAQNNIIRPAILWNDGRTSKEVDYLNNVVGKDKLSALTANIAFAGFTAPKLLWMRENEPENFRKIAKIMLPKDYLTYKLTGVHACDYPILFYKNQHYGAVMLYGHVHNTREWSLVEKWKNEQWTMGIPSRLINVGCMMAYMNYTPRTLDELLEANPQPMIERTRKDGTNAGENSNGEL